MFDKIAEGTKALQEARLFQLGTDIREKVVEFMKTAPLEVEEKALKQGFSRVKATYDFSAFEFRITVFDESSTYTKKWSRTYLIEPQFCSK